ncbi:Gfo/Idh/MocA family oxidoreductase [Skeletonema marinoi]|uniref:Gfo/Idh/MocA family oxidoreductase n=1 Tax=Skeletonema marinoi TaxID=267567 RepID=A0AAD8XVH4_9STRA|nr:Gfo/Idh/MocA family oxidoreductase [Skeletonema marinoi]
MNSFYTPLLLLLLISSSAWLLIAAASNLHPSFAFTSLPFTTPLHPHNMMSTTTAHFATKSSSIQWGIIGLGDVCAIKSGPAFYKSRNSKLIAVMRRSPGMARRWVTENREVIQRYNTIDDDNSEIRGYDNVNEMIAENINELDAIYIATPPGVHLENVRQIISALDDATTTTGVDDRKQQSSRLKAIYVEKPCGRCAWETRIMIDELHHRNIQFFPAYVSRAHERTQVLHKLLSNKSSIGDQVRKVHYVQRGSSFARGLDGEEGIIPWRLVAEYSGGGLVMDMGCHVLDRIDYLFGPIVDVKSEVLRKGGGGGVGDEEGSYPLVEDYVSMNGRIGQCDWAVISSEGAIVECLWDFSPPDKNNEKNDEDELIITGTNGSLRMAGMGAGLPIEVLDVDGNVIETIEFEAPMHAAQPLIQSIVNELRGVDVDDEEERQQQHYLGKSPARAENAIRTSEVLDAILNSYYGGRHDEFWTRPESWPGLK